MSAPPTFVGVYILLIVWSFIAAVYLEDRASANHRPKKASNAADHAPVAVLVQRAPRPRGRAERAGHKQAA